MHKMVDKKILMICNSNTVDSTLNSNFKILQYNHCLSAFKRSSGIHLFGLN
ncbi:hypothetical protein HMPREF1508_0099 [Shuttleworthella sp. MSX8B]|nr:hypothetical protein HMPREF1508_0099 [Shuttleworthia sp. MSX8B]